MRPSASLSSSIFLLPSSFLRCTFLDASASTSTPPLPVAHHPHLYTSSDRITVLDCLFESRELTSSPPSFSPSSPPSLQPHLVPTPSLHLTLTRCSCPLGATTYCTSVKPRTRPHPHQLEPRRTHRWRLERREGLGHEENYFEDDLESPGRKERGYSDRIR